MSCTNITLSKVSFTPTVTLNRIEIDATISSYSDMQNVEVAATISNASVNIGIKPEVNDTKWLFSRVCALAEFISAIANGYWMNRLPWSDKEGWKN